LERITVRRMDQDTTWTKTMEGTDIESVGEAGRKVGVGEEGKVMEVEARGRRIDDWRQIGSEKRGTKRMMGWEEVAGGAGDRNAARAEQTVKGEMTFPDWMGKRTQ
jgi:hypothetical protein